ncbi:TPA: hypothetical protein ACXETX_004952, partial [Klebsiella pneumoniae]
RGNTGAGDQKRKPDYRVKKINPLMLYYHILLYYSTNYGDIGGTSRMKLNNYLSKFFDVEENEVENDEGEKIPSLWLFEKGEDSEPVVILKQTEKPGEWRVGDIYSALTNDARLSEEQIKKLAKDGMITKN